MSECDGNISKECYNTYWAKCKTCVEKWLAENPYDPRGSVTKVNKP